jgi:ABC-2 type transport system ATP-binding protein
MTINESRTRSTPDDVRSGGIRLAGLHKSYGPVHAVKGLDLHIAAGETVALLGPNGAGKSTTIDMLLGLSQPDGGTVEIFGLSPQDAVADGAIGAMLQTGGLIQGLTVRELLVMMASLYPRPLGVDAVLASCGIEDLAARRTQSLSGGQTQRVRAAMALISDPDLLVLDEPTVAMDVEARHAFWTAMRAFASTGRTVVFATHYLEEADAYADRIVLMAGGVVVADGPANEIRATVGRRTIRATLADVDLASLARLPGVDAVDRRGAAVLLDCSDSDTAIRALLAVHAGAKDIEITGAGLEAAFLSLTKTEQTTDLKDAR